MANKLIDYSMLDTSLKAMLSGGGFQPVTYSVISGGTNPGGYEYVRVMDTTHKGEIYYWDSATSSWKLIIADDTNINWTDILNKPGTFPPTAHTHTKADITDFAHNHDGTYAPVSHNHDGTYAPVSHNHDASYSPLGHNHNTAYSDINHNHDGRYYTQSTLDAAIGSPANLTTTDKSNIVAAINEVNAKPTGGGSLTTVTVSGSLNAVLTNGFYHVPASTSNAPTTAVYEMLVISDGTNITQFAMSTSGSGLIYQRYSANNGSSWGSWFQVITGNQLASSPQNVSTLSLTPKALYDLGFADSAYLILNASSVDLNSVNTTQYRYYTGTLTNQPTEVTSTTDVMVVNYRLNGSTDQLMYLMTNESVPRLFYRAKTANTWGAWIQSVDTSRVASKITVSSTQPSSPATNDIWIQI